MAKAYCCRFKCWQDGSSSSPVDGQWYPQNTTLGMLTPSKAEAGLSVHLKLPQTKQQWDLQQQLQQQLNEHSGVVANLDIQATSQV